MMLSRLFRALPNLGAVLVMILAIVGSPSAAPAQMKNEIVNGNGRWTGEIRFALASQEDVSCKIALSLKNFEIRDSFNCYAVWWLPPGRSWSIEGEVKNDGSLVAAKVNWGYVKYAALQGDLRKSSGAAGGPAFDMVATNPGDVEVRVLLTPEAGATEEGKPIDDTDQKGSGEPKIAAVTGVHDGIYSGKKHCTSTAHSQLYVMRVRAMVLGSSAKVEITTTGATGSSNQYKFSQNLSEQGTVKYKLGWSEEMTFRFSDDPPVARSIYGDCDFELEKHAFK